MHMWKEAGSWVNQTQFAMCMMNETATRVHIAVRNKTSIQISMHDRSRLSKTDRKAEWSKHDPHWPIKTSDAHDQSLCCIRMPVYIRLCAYIWAGTSKQINDHIEEVVRADICDSAVPRRCDVRLSCCSVYRFSRVNYTMENLENETFKAADALVLS